MTAWHKRVKREQEIKKDLILKHYDAILSTNIKTGCSLNLPVSNCNPSTNCQKSCYACSGGHMITETSLTKSLSVNELIKTEKGLLQLIGECVNLKYVRLMGSGDFMPEHIPFIIKLAKTCTDTIFYGFTRKPELAKKLNHKLPNLSVILSIDSSTNPETYKKYKDPIAYGPVLQNETVPEDKRIIVVFPYHAGGRVVNNVNKNKKDCPCVWNPKEITCLTCKRCVYPFAE